MIKDGRILIVEDNDLTRNMFVRRVEAEGHRTEVADDGQAALDMLSRRSFELVLLDIHMPIMDGYEVLKVMRSDPDLVDMPVIVISSDDGLDSVIQAIDLGADDYFPKNVEQPLLRARISACLEKKRRSDWQQKHFDSLLRAMSMIEKGEMDIQLNIPDDDLYGSLFRGFNMMTNGLQESTRILEIAQDLSSEMQLDVLLQRIMSATTSLLSAERSTLYIHDKKTNTLWSLVAEGMNKSEIRIPSDKGIAGLAFSQSETVNISDPYSHPEFNPEFDRQTGFKTRNILCMPIINRLGKCIGVTQVLNKRDGDFTQKDVDRMRAFTSQISISLDNARLLDDVMKIKNYNESILKCTSNGMITLDLERRFVTVNEASRKILQISEDEIIGRKADDYFCDPNGWIVDSIKKVEAEGVEDSAFQAELQLGDKGVVSMNLTVVPLADAAGETIGTMLMIEDITDEKRIKSTMARYMSKEVVDQLLEHGDLELGGQLQKVSILFSDLRGFTSLSEILGPTATVELLNEYFSEMVDIIFKHQGILDKYIGDAIMALFGAPMSRGDDAGNALVAANKMQRAVVEINRRRQALELKPIDMGIGISTGTVIAGNIGSPKRMEYTVIGDSVNLASRLESANKFYGTKILVSDFLVKDMKGKVTIREIDLLRVKGKSEPVAVYEALDFYDEESFPNRDQVLVTYNEALTLYRNRDWGRAKAAFEDVLSQRLCDGPAKIYLSRCREFLEAPPQEEWDGVWQMADK